MWLTQNCTKYHLYQVNDNRDLIYYIEFTSVTSAFHETDVIESDATEAVFQLSSKDDVQEGFGLNEDLPSDPLVVGRSRATPFWARVRLFS
jgi:hypothetical protein